MTDIGSEGVVDLSPYPWVTHDIAGLVTLKSTFKGAKPKAAPVELPEDVRDLVMNKHAVVRNLFFDFLKAQNPQDVEKFAKTMAQMGRRSAGKQIDDNEARLMTRYASFLPQLVSLQNVVISAINAMGPEKGLSDVREAMVDQAFDQAFDQSGRGVPEWLDAAKSMAAGRAWKLAIVESVTQFGVIEKALGKGDKPDPTVKAAIDALGEPYRSFREREGEFRKAVQDLVTLSQKQGADGAEVTACSKAVLRTGQEVGLATEELARAIEAAANQVNIFMKERAADIYKENLATVANDVSTALLATKEVTFLASTTIGILSAVFFPLAIVAGALAIVSAACQNQFVQKKAFGAVEDTDMMAKLLSTQFGEGTAESAEKAEKRFEMIETNMDRTDRLQLIVETGIEALEYGSETVAQVAQTLLPQTVMEGAKVGAAAVKDGVGIASKVLQPISVTVGSASLMFAFSKGDPKGMQDKWDKGTTEAFKKAVGKCKELAEDQLESEASPECQIDEFDQGTGAFKVTMFGMEGDLYPDGRFEPTGHQYALNQAVKLATKAKNHIQTLAAPGSADGRQYGSATVTVDFGPIDGPPTWNRDEVSLTFTTGVAIVLDDFPGFAGWTEEWEVKVSADVGAVEFVGDKSARFKEMPYMRLVTYYGASGRDLLQEERSQDHPFDRLVGDLDDSGRLVVLASVRDEEKADVEKWLEASGTRQEFKERHDRAIEAEAGYR